jgi:hypothetical protein
MKPRLFLRIASILTLVHSALHTVGGVFSKPEPGVGEATYAVMQSNYFHVLGVTRSYADFYRGFGLAITLFLTAEGVVFWLLASLAKKHPLELRPILLVFMLAYVVFAVISQTYFFLGPVLAELLIAACLLGAIMTAKTASTTRVNA